GLDDAVGDVEREHVDEPSVPIDDDRAGLAVHLRRLDGDAELAHLPAEADQQAADALPAGDRMRPRRARSAAVAVDDDVAREQVEQSLEVTSADGREEPRREALALPPGRLQAGLLLIDVAPRAERELAAVVL